MKPLKLYVVFLYGLLLLPGLLKSACADEDLPQAMPDELSPVDTLFDEPMRRGIALLYEDHFEQALAIFDSLQRAQPDHPAPYFYKAAVYQTWMIAYRFNAYQKELESEVQKAIANGEALLTTKAQNPWLHFYMGAAYGYRAFYKMRKFRWIGAYRDGMKSIGGLRMALTLEPKLYDVYLGLGSYHYWRTARSKFIRSVAFWMKDLRDLGLKQIAFAAQHARYVRDESLYVLASAYFDNNQPEQALIALDTIIVRNKPEVVSYLYLRGRTLARFQRWEEAERFFRTALARLDAKSYAAAGYKVECTYWIAKALDGQQNYAEAYRLTQSAVALSRTRNADAELESQFESFDEVSKNLTLLHNELASKQPK